MRSLASCFTLALLGIFFFFAAFFQTRQLSELPVQPTATPIWASFPSSAVTPYVTEAIYQPFQRGFMLWRADQNCVYAIATSIAAEPRHAIIPSGLPASPDSMIHSYGYCLSVAPLTHIPPNLNPPTGYFEPTGVLGKVWHYYLEVSTELGFATAPEQHYTATVPTNDGAAVMDGSPFTIAQMTLPDGTIFACGSRAATAGTC